MTKKDYMAIAEMIATTKDAAKPTVGLSTVPAGRALEWMENLLCKYFTSCNPRFDADKFHAACQRYERVERIHGVKTIPECPRCGGVDIELAEENR